MDSSWYFLRYLDPDNSREAFSPTLAKSWMPVDVYVGGIEHAILHLLYARFVTKFLHGIDALPVCDEPFSYLLTQGMVQGQTFKAADSGRYLKPDEIRTSSDGRVIEAATGRLADISWEKMSKSKYNGVDPQTVIDQYGADTIRVFTLFKAPPQMDLNWDASAIEGPSRWLRRIWRLCEDYRSLERSAVANGKALGHLSRARKQAIRGVDAALDQHVFNVAIAELMKFSNVLEACDPGARQSMEYSDALRALLIMLYPFAPHLSSECWQSVMPTIDSRQSQDISQVPWPIVDSDDANELITIVIQVCCA